MANLTIRRGQPSAPAGQLVPRGMFEPFRLMRDLIRWDPFQEMAPLAPQLSGEFVPQVEVKETKDGYVFKADVPGIAEKDLDITLTGNRLSICGKREEEKEEGEREGTYYAYERSYGSFARSFTLPEGVDASSVHADLKNGVLTLIVPKSPEAQPKRIEVKAGEMEKPRTKA